MSFNRLSNHPSYPSRIKTTDPNYEENCPYYEKKRIPKPDYEDSEDISEKELKDNRFIWTWFNDSLKLISLKDSDIEFKNGKPITPFRTGIRGRGLLPKFGPQHAADPIVTCYKDNKLYFLAVLRCDVDEWAIPGGFMDPGENYGDTLRREFVEEACEGTDIEVLNEIFKDGDIIYAGTNFDDPRTTDNAWIETIVVHYHIPDEIANKIKLKPQEGETKKVEWKSVNSNLYASHSNYLKIVDEKMQTKKENYEEPINFQEFNHIVSVFVYLVTIIMLMYQVLSIDKEIRIQEKFIECIELDKEIKFLEFCECNENLDLLPFNCTS